MLSKERYRIIMMVPTEAYVDVDNIEQAKETIKWLQKQYPPVKLGDQDIKVNFLSLEYIEGGKGSSDDYTPPTDAA